MAFVQLHAQHLAPDAIKEEAGIALSHYPELADTPITFKIVKKVKQSTMRAQPKFNSLIKGRKKRAYVILISEHIKISNQVFLTQDVPKDIMIGWLGHELGHVMDYRERSTLNLIWFGLKYYFSGAYIKEAERAADTFAVAHGMHEYILKTKTFILENADIDEKYKARIRRYYLSPEEIMAIVKKREASGPRS
ncbi:M48 family metalloprotease [Zobellia galactanivorans]|uniref:Uncharacterized protein n=1 Tax=Zobellia galactanivorans (strain DSM 12802 / CCUG 47099 / CIP 106680 / NCIMB 13871 / Dsij) TaxID=63186 RepID=G0L673_ZOBGA|nr:hypothetical protein [Zobellia galactanivorans]CAZ96756.1 Conserved hypothetical protein [Zobellia galactanivorans]